MSEKNGYTAKQIAAIQNFVTPLIVFHAGKAIEDHAGQMEGFEKSQYRLRRACSSISCMKLR